MIRECDDSIARTIEPSNHRVTDSLAVYLDRRILTILLLGFSSGLPLALTASTLGVRLMEAGVDQAAIGLFAAVATPYNIKFLWAPLMDSLAFPLLCRMLGQRRGWLLAMQAGLIPAIAVLGSIDPLHAPWIVAGGALLVAILSASQDIVIDAYRVEILPAALYGAGAATVVLGYRLGMIASTAGAFYLASYLSWPRTYFIMTGLMGIGIAAVLFGSEPVHTAVPRHSGAARWLKDAVIAPFLDFTMRRGWAEILLFILLYKLADAFMGLMPNLFYLQLGFTKMQVAAIAKLFGVIATIAGGFIGGVMVARLGIIRSLWIGGMAHALTNLMYVAQTHMGADIRFLTLAISLENITGGMGTAAFVAYISSLCNQRFTATQYALLSSLSAMGRTWLSTPAGWLAKQLGWAGFFLFAALLALPGLIVLWYLPRKENQSASA